jgi:hypothetical protein
MQLLLVLLLLVCGTCARSLPFPYPAPTRFNASRLVAFASSDDSGDDVLTASTLQGQLARSKAAIFIVQSSSDLMWLDELQSSVWGVSISRASSLGELWLALNQSHALPQYYVLTTLKNTSAGLSYVAASPVAAVLATQLNVGVLQQLGLRQLADVRSLSVESVLQLFPRSSWNDRVFSLQDPLTRYCCLVDYAVFARSITWWDTDMQSSYTRNVLKFMQPGSAIFGWGVDEGALVAAVAERGGFVHASDWARNLATLSGYRMGLPPRQSRGHRSSTRSNCASQGQHTVSFLMTDGDNVQWLLNTFASAAWWTSPDRGSVPLGWTLSPAIIELAPVVASYLYRTRTSNDYFVGAPSGLGYTNPDLMEDALRDFAQLTAQGLQQMDSQDLNVIGQAYSSSTAEALLEVNNWPHNYPTRAILF